MFTLNHVSQPFAGRYRCLRPLLVSLLLVVSGLGILSLASPLTHAQPTLADASRPAELRMADWDQIRAVLPLDALTSQQAYLKASNTGTGDGFGVRVAVSGDTVVVGAYTSDAAAGAAYVFTRTAGVWSQQASLKAANADETDSFGQSVAVSGDTIVVGAPYEDSCATGVNGDGTNNACALAGAAYVFTRTGSSWSQQAYLKAANTEKDDRFGWSVAVSGDTLVVGTPNESSSATGVNGDGTNNAALASGAAYVFTRTGRTWSQQAYLKAANTGIADVFGRSVALSDNTLVVGAPQESSSATGVNGDGTNNAAIESGAAYVFTREGTTWSQQAYLKAANTGANDRFGERVAVSGATLVVGAPWESSSATGVNGDGANNAASYAGAAYVFTRVGTTWSQQAYLKASNSEAYDYFGWSVAVSGDSAVVGTPQESSSATGVNGDGTNNAAVGAGAAYVFTRVGSSWSQRAYLKAANSEMSDHFGEGVALADYTVVAGAPGEDSSATGVDGDGTNNAASGAGAAYAFQVMIAPILTAPAETGITSIRPTFQGIATPGSTITVIEASATLCTAAVQSDGRWMCSATSDLSIGAHTVSVSASNTDADQTNVVTRTFTVVPVLYQVSLPIIFK